MKTNRGRVARALVPCSAFAGRVYLNVFLVAALWILVPVVFGWQPMLISSGSMSPAIAPGDIVVISAAGDAVLPQGAVITYDDPGGADRLVTHRVIGHDEDGSYRTKGDANPSPDSTAVPPGNVHGFARLLVPFVTRPIIWARDGQLVQVAAWLVTTLLAIVAGTRQPPSGKPTRRPRQATPATLAVPPAVVVAEPLGPLWTAQLAPQPRTGRVARRGMIVLALLVTSSLAVSPAASTLSGTTASTGSSWQALDLAPPTGLSATPGCSGTTTTVELAWTATASAAADGYDIYRKAIDGAETKIATITDPSTTGYVDSNLATGTYTYTLTTTLDSWASEHSTEASALVSC